MLYTCSILNFGLAPVLGMPLAEILFGEQGTRHYFRQRKRRTSHEQFYENPKGVFHQ
jgi:hypothetical protein